jgi:hypothetical protein
MRPISHRTSLLRAGQSSYAKRNNIKTRHLARKLEHKMYGPFEILDIISLTAVRLHLPKTWKIYPVFHVSLIEPFVKGNRDVDLNTILKTSDPIENIPEYDIDKVMGSTEKDGKVLYLVKCKGWPAKNTGPGNPSKVFIQ